MFMNFSSKLFWQHTQFMFYFKKLCLREKTLAEKVINYHLPIFYLFVCSRKSMMYHNNLLFFFSNTGWSWNFLAWWNFRIFRWINKCAQWKLHHVSTKGQLISERNFDVFKSSKNKPNFLRITATASKISQINRWSLLYQC